MKKLALFCTLLPLLSLSSCEKVKKETKKIELHPNLSYRIEINFWGGLMADKNTILLDNENIDRDSLDLSRFKIKPLTIYFINSRPVESEKGSKRFYYKPYDTVLTKITEHQSEELLKLTQAFFEAFKISNIDTLRNGAYYSGIIHDDANASISLRFRMKTLTAEIESVNHSSNKTKELSELIEFITKIKRN